MELLPASAFRHICTGCGKHFESRGYHPDARDKGVHQASLRTTCDDCTKYPCGQCGQMYTAEGFYWSLTRTGATHRTSPCKDCTLNRPTRTVYFKLHNLELRRRAGALIDAAKSRPCMDCRRSFSPCCMDFDHVRGTKLFTIGQMRSRALKLIRAEIAKCDVVCANCHRIRTRNRTLGYPPY